MVARRQPICGFVCRVSQPQLAGHDPEKALRGIRKLVADAVKDMKANREPVPEPLSSRRYSGKFMVRVPPEVHRRLAVEAAEEDISLNRLVSEKLSS